jgi:hypothetical protein
MIVARQFIAWNMSKKEIRPVGNGLILTHNWLVVLIVARLWTQSHRPYGTDPFLNGIPGNKLPGYDHLVPPGQTHLRPYVDAHARPRDCLATIV